MTLLDRYLHAVRKRLPRNQRDDIAAELRDLLSSQIEAEEAALRRPLTDDEVAVILKRCGRPRMVAARYASSGYLIGPALYPAYITSLRVLAWVIVPIGLISVPLSALLADDPFMRLAQRSLAFAVMLLALFAVVTIVFARAERAGGIWTGADTWDPRDLPAAEESGPTPRSEVICSFLLTGFYLLMWIGVLPVGSWIATLNRWFGGTPLPFGFAPVWNVVSPMIVALMVASMARDIVAIVRPQWTFLRAYAGIGLYMGALLVLIQLVRADRLFVVTDPAGAGAAHIDHFNRLFFILFVIATVGVWISALVAARRIVRLRWIP